MGRVEIELHDGLLTLEAHNAPLGQIIGAIGQRLGVKVTIAGELDPRFTCSFTATPVNEVVRRLIEDAITVIFFTLGMRARTARGRLQKFASTQWRKTSGNPPPARA